MRSLPRLLASLVPPDLLRNAEPAAPAQPSPQPQEAGRSAEVAALLRWDRAFLDAPEQLATHRLQAPQAQEAWSSAEVATLSRLAEAVDGYLGNLDCRASLQDLQDAAQALGADMASRSYRDTFAINYRGRFQGQERGYTQEIFHAAATVPSFLIVNGTAYQVSPQTLDTAAALQHRMFELTACLVDWAAAESWPLMARPSRAEVVATFAYVDIAWAEFENRYINDIMLIEDHARELVKHAIAYESQLRTVGTQEGAQCRFVASLALLNSVANIRGKRRKDLDGSVLEIARGVLAATPSGTGSRVAAKILAEDVIASFESLQRYFQDISRCVEIVDPQLSNNPGLVARLEDWEESWLLGRRYLPNPVLLDAVCDVVAGFQRVQAVVPAFTGMVDDCDVEFFLVLPRLVMLFFAASPQEKRCASVLLQTLLPHRFHVATLLLRAQPGDEFKKLAELGARAQLELLQAAEATDKSKRACADIMEYCFGEREKDRSRAVEEKAWRTLVKRAVEGSRDGNAVASPQTAVEELMRELERWSMELQRHCAQDWNKCSAMFAHCLNQSPMREGCTAVHRVP